MIFVLDIVLLLIGLFIIIRETNLIKKVIGLNIFQSSVFIFYLINYTVYFYSRCLINRSHANQNPRDEGNIS